ncbi:MAG: methionine--tRNA ligase [Pirellulaceae bacterium]|nr:MAG: methionine--tRNA ligase [Pirellulaceae bacterium]
MAGRRLLVTAALPYANGHIHIGHLLEYVQTDIWVRFQKLRGHRCIYICADDTHGTPIMIRARQEGRSELELIAEMQQHHTRDFADFEIAFDHYGSTNSPENYELCQRFWRALRQAGLVVEKEIQQLFDPQAGVFLADRFVKGTCPRCGAPDQYGDNCERCGQTYRPTELRDARSTLTGATPELRTTRQLFVHLEALRPFLIQWTQEADHVPREVANYLMGHFLHEPLRDWDVSRPAPYFGFEIPDSPGNYWYVWFDAPIGYIASTAAWCKLHGESLEDWWMNPEVEIHHFIGKDITYFHTLFWPAMLKTAGFQLPRRIHIHGFLTVDGRKMSKRDGTFVLARTYLKHLQPVYFRYYLASKLGPRLDDVDLNLEEFVNKVNSDLVGKVVNLASRTARFVQGQRLSDAYPDDQGLFARGVEVGNEIAAAYEEGDYSRAMRAIMGLADAANVYVETAQPWSLQKDSDRTAELRDVCTVALSLFWQIMVYLSPVTPSLAAKTESLFGKKISRWEDAAQPLTQTAVGTFQHFLQRVDRKDVDAMIEESREPIPAPTYQDSDAPLKAEPLAPTCTIEDFAKVDLRVARVVAAEDVPQAKKLLKLTVSLGGNERRTIFAGIKAAYKPEQLVGRLVIIVANLAPRQMSFGVSEGMVTAAGTGGQDVYLLSVDEGAKPGQRVH